MVVLTGADIHDCTMVAQVLARVRFIRTGPAGPVTYCHVLGLRGALGPRLQLSRHPYEPCAIGGSRNHAEKPRPATTVGDIDAAELVCLGEEQPLDRRCRSGGTG